MTKIKDLPKIERPREKLIVKKLKTKKEIYFKCKKCGDEIFWNTHKQLVFCKCSALGVDGCDFYVRILGDEKNHEEILK